MKVFNTVRLITLTDFVDSYPTVKEYELFHILTNEKTEELDRRNSIIGNRQELLRIPKFKKDFWIINDTFETGYFLFNDGKLIQGFDKEKACLTVFFHRF